MRVGDGGEGGEGGDEEALNVLLYLNLSHPHYCMHTKCASLHNKFVCVFSHH